MYKPATNNVPTSILCFGIAPWFLAPGTISPFERCRSFVPSLLRSKLTVVVLVLPPDSASVSLLLCPLSVQLQSHKNYNARYKQHKHYTYLFHTSSKKLTSLSYAQKFFIINHPQFSKKDRKMALKSNFANSHILLG